MTRRCWRSTWDCWGSTSRSWTHPSSRRRCARSASAICARQMGNHKLRNGRTRVTAMRNHLLQEVDVEYGSIEREMYVDAPPEVVFDVVSDPDHITTWWPDSARYERRAGASGEIAFGDPSQDGMVVQLTVVEVSPPR